MRKTHLAWMEWHQVWGQSFTDGTKKNMHRQRAILWSTHKFCIMPAQRLSLQCTHFVNVSLSLLISLVAFSFLKSGPGRARATGSVTLQGGKLNLRFEWTWILPRYLETSWESGWLQSRAPGQSFLVGKVRCSVWGPFFGWRGWPRSKGTKPWMVGGYQETWKNKENRDVMDSHLQPSRVIQLER